MFLTQKHLSRRAVLKGIGATVALPFLDAMVPAGRAFAMEKKIRLVYPESGFTGAFHPTSHHSGREEKVVNFAKINAYHVGMIPYFLETLKNTPDGDSHVLANTLLLYGSAMGDSNLHNHKRVPFFLAGHAGGALQGGLHLKAKNGTPLASAMLGVLRALGFEDLESFGDSEGALDLNGVPA